MFRRYHRLFVAGLVLAACVAVFAQPAPSAAQEPVYYTGWMWHPGTIHYQQVHQGWRWEWSPSLGWHRHDYFVEVPVQTPGQWVYHNGGANYFVAYR